MKNNSKYVSTKIGTLGDVMLIPDFGCAGGGKTYPGAVVPFGMVQFSPDTFEGGDNGAGYSYNHTTIDGFSVNHVSGMGWYGDLGNFQIMPTTGELNLLSGTYKDALTTKDERGYESDFNHDTEVTEAGYYAVTLDTYGIRAETTASPHTGMIRMTYPKNTNRRVQINLARRIAGRSSLQEIEIVDTHTIKGCIHCPSTHGGFGRGRGHVDYNLYFWAEFSEDWDSHGVWNKNAQVHTSSSYEGEELWFYADFEAGDKPITLKVAISYINAEGAKYNFDAEAKEKTFDMMHEEATKAWDEALSVIDIEDTRVEDDKRTIFYTTLYHALLDPRIFSDANGNYLCADGSVKNSDKFVKRTFFSGWDGFRSIYPLLTLIKPDAVNDEINTLLDIAENQIGFFPRFEMLGCETGCMCGDPGIIVTVDAIRKGIANFDVKKAYEIALRTALDEKSTRHYTAEMNKYGYVPAHCGDYTISDTVENVFVDYCISVFAHLMGDGESEKIFRERAKNWRHVFDDSIGWMRRKNADGTWAEFTDIYDIRGCQESNIFQQTWFVPHEVGALIEKMGREEFIAKIERLMSEGNLSSFWSTGYNHSNEPSHLIPHMLNSVGCPDRTQYWVRRIQNESYGTSEYGFCGNEDVGQLSGWFVLTSLGIHMLTSTSNTYQVNTPLFKRAEVKLSKEYHPGKVADTIVFETDLDPAENIYIKGISVNGTPIHRTWLKWEEIVNGGVIRFELSKTPDNSWISENPIPENI